MCVAYSGIHYQPWVGWLMVALPHAILKLHTCILMAMRLILLPTLLLMPWLNIFIDQFHNKLLGTKHKVLTTEEFGDSTRRNERADQVETCDEHENRELRLICRNCTTIFCVECSMDSACEKLQGKTSQQGLTMLSSSFHKKLNL